MKKIVQIPGFSWVHIVSAVVTIIVILYFVPGQSHKKYIYEVGRPWSAPALYAPAQMVVALNPEAEKVKKDSIQRVFVPIYKYDASVAQVALKKADDAPALVRSSLKVQLEKVYNGGIVEASIYDSIQSGRLPAVRTIDENNKAQQVPTSGMRSARAAYEYIESTLGQMAVALLSASEFNLSAVLMPNYTEDVAKNKKYLENEFLKATVQTPIDKGELIIARGEKVTAQNALEIEECERILNNEEAAGSSYPMLGYAVVVTSLILLLMVYISIYRRRTILTDRRKLVFILMLMALVTVSSFVLSHRTTYGPLLIPMSLVPVIIITFFDSRTAFFVSVIQVLLCSLSVAGDTQLNFIVLHTVACNVALFTLQELTKRSQLIRTAICVFFAYVITYVSLRIIEDGNVSSIDWMIMVYFAVNAVLLSFAYVVIFVFEKGFGFISKVTLVELSDINNPILQELSERCPGTFQHSIQLSNLVAEAAREIGANAPLARAGALYHDIGKMDNPAFFTENQHDVNPHEVLTPEQSAKIVIRHVADGVRRAEKAKLPEEIKDFIREHHGRNLTRYFYNTACNAANGEAVDPAPYTYPGPNPRTKETSLLMMADATEAASRSLKEYNDETISALVNKIIDGQIAQGLMKDSPLSFNDVEVVKKVFISRLRTMYHTRISYPELKSKQ